MKQLEAQTSYWVIYGAQLDTVITAKGFSRTEPAAAARVSAATALCAVSGSPGPFFFFFFFL